MEPTYDVSPDHLRGKVHRGPAPTAGPGSRGDRPRARAPPQHDRPRGAAQRHAPRRLLPAPTRRVVRQRPPLALPAESAVLDRELGADPDPAPRGLEPGAGGGPASPRPRARDQPRDDLPACVGGQAGGRHVVPAPARRAQATAQTVRPLRQPGPPSGQTPDHRTPAECRTAVRARALGGRHDARRGPAC